MPDQVQTTRTQLEKLQDALTATGYSFAHHGWSRAPEGTYGVWAEEGGEDLVADGRHAERGTRVAVDLYTRDDSQTPRVTVEAQLDTLESPWRLDSVDYEPDTGLIHWLWVVGVHG